MMRTVMLASVRLYARRYVAAVLAIVAGVSFIVVTAAVSSATKAGMLTDLSTSYAGADVVVSSLNTNDVAKVLQAVDDVGPAAVNATAHTSISAGGRTLSGDGSVGSVASAPSLRWQHLDRGHYPDRPDEALADADAAGSNEVAIGDVVLLGEGEEQVRVTITGVVRHSTGELAAPLYLTWPGLRGLGDSTLVENVVVGGAVSPGEVRSALEGGGIKDPTVDSVDDHLQAQARSITRDVDVISSMLLVFAAIALFVSILVIANTFTVLLAQRLRDFALLRCVGATRKQVMRSVRQEALLVGVVSASTGVLVGLGLGQVLVAVIDRFVPALPTGAADVSWRWLVGSWLVGVLVTLAASVFPARRSTRISPLQALSPRERVDVRNRAGALRIGLAGTLVVGGTGLLLWSMAAHSLLTMVIGGFVSFFGMLLLGPVLVPACVRVAGLLTGRVFGVPGRLAASNAVRNPRRTASTAASLLVGTTLMTGMVTGIATVSGSVDREMDVEYPLDVTFSSSAPLSGTTLAAVRAVDGITSAVPLEGTTAVLSQKGRDLGDLSVLGVPPDRSVLRGAPGFATPGADTVYLPWDTISEAEIDTAEPLRLTVAGRRVDLDVSGVLGLKSAALVSPDVLQRLDGGNLETRAIWARASDRVDADEAAETLGTLASSQQAELGGGMQNRSYVHLQLRILILVSVGLLAVALLIALLGIGNTLGLSVLERTREHAMLRAMGLTRGQLRGTLAVEAVLLAAVTSLIGVLLGSAYAFVGVQAMLGGVLEESGVTLQVPFGQLLLVVLGAGVAGLAACVLPARTAARVTPAAGLAGP